MYRWATWFRKPSSLKPASVSSTNCPWLCSKLSKICQMRIGKSAQVCSPHNGKCTQNCNIDVPNVARAIWPDFCRLSTMYYTLAVHSSLSLQCATFAGYPPSNIQAVRSMAAMVEARLRMKRWPCWISSNFRVQCIYMHINVGNKMKEFSLLGFLFLWTLLAEFMFNKLN